TSEPDLIERDDIGVHDHIHVESGVLQAHRYVTGIDDQPIASQRCPSKVELDDDAPARNAIDRNAPPHPPQQDDRIELGWTRRTKGPASAPFAKKVDDPLQLSPGGRQTILGRAAARSATPFQYTRPLQATQTLRKKCTGHVRKAALELIEMI